MGTNKTGLYNCFSLFHSVATGTVQKEEWSSSSIQQQLTETCHDLQKNFLIFELLSIFSSFLPSIFHSIFVSMHGSKRDEIHSSMKGRRFLFFSRISVNRLYISARIQSTSKKSHASTSFHQVRIDYSSILYNILSIFICFHLQNFYTICIYIVFSMWFKSLSNISFI